jgi:hypothetical protein
LIHDQHTIVAPIEGRIERAHKFGCAWVVSANDDAIGLHEVVNRSAFL